MTDTAISARFDIRPVVTKRELKAFIRMPYALYADDPNYVAPLEFELTARLDPTKNPGLKGAPHQLWVAYQNGEAVGRISALVNPAHLDKYNDGAGHFGFIEAIDDGELFDALIATASTWLREQGMTKIVGPFNFSVSEECGLLIDGFDTPPYIMMPHGKPYYQGHFERLGFSKAVDMYALEWLPVREFIPEKRLRFVEKVLSRGDVEIRSLNTKDFLGDIRIIIDIYNDAWADNWGALPFEEEHVRHMASELKPIIQPHNVVICYYNGEPAAYGLVLPNINHVIRDFGGKLLPFNWIKFLWHLKVKGIPQSRMPLMGVRKSLQKKPAGAAFAYKMIDIVNSSNIDHGVTHSECSWILENNESMLTMLLDMGSRIYKTYRIYERPL